MRQTSTKVALRSYGTWKDDDGGFEIRMKQMSHCGFTNDVVIEKN